MTLTRRQLINRGGVIGAGAVAVSFGMSATETAAARPGESQGGAELFPPLKAASDDLLALPPGFEYEVVAKAGATSIHDGSGDARHGTSPSAKATSRPGHTFVIRGPWERYLG